MIAASVVDIARSGRPEQYNAKTTTESDKGNILLCTTSGITVTSSLLKYCQVNIRYKVKGILWVFNSSFQSDSEVQTLNNTLYSALAVLLDLVFTKNDF